MTISGDNIRKSLPNGEPGNASRDELKQLGEGQKVTVVAWALTASLSVAAR